MIIQSLSKLKLFKSVIFGDFLKNVHVKTFVSSVTYGPFLAKKISVTHHSKLN